MADRTLIVQWDRREIAHLTALPAAVARAVRKAGATALRDVRSEASKRIRAHKRIKVAYITRAFRLRRNTASRIDDMSWALDVSGKAVPLVAYPHRQTKKGVSVEVNRGKRTLVKGAFIATLRSGHEGVFRRRTKARLPIFELLGSRPVDALLHKGEAEAVAMRGQQSFNTTFSRLLPIEIDKTKGSVGP